MLYNLTSTWLIGRGGELAARGHSREVKRDDPRIPFGLGCTAEGCPISVQVFKGNTADPATVASQVAKLKERFGIEHVAWVGDRGLLTSARIEQVLKPQGMGGVSSLRAPRIAPLAAERGPFQPSLFDERNLLELMSLVPGAGGLGPGGDHADLAGCSMRYGVLPAARPLYRGHDPPSL